MRRSLKSQIQRDVKRVFLNLSDFAVLEHIRYYRNGNNKPPLDLHIPIVVDEDANNNNVWNRSRTYTRVGNDQTLHQISKTIFCALEDFNPPPKKGRRMEVGDHAYEVVGVAQEGGMLKIELRELEE